LWTRKYTPSCHCRGHPSRNNSADRTSSANWQKELGPPERSFQGFASPTKTISSVGSQVCDRRIGNHGSRHCRLTGLNGHLKRIVEWVDGQIEGLVRMRAKSALIRFFWESMNLDLPRRVTWKRHHTARQGCGQEVLSLPASRRGKAESVQDLHDRGSRERGRHSW
jgi:hypothetical protein